MEIGVYTHLKVFNLSHRTGLAAHRLRYVVVGVTNIPLGHFHFKVEFLSFVALQTINPCSFKNILGYIINKRNIYIYFRIGANNFRLVSAFIFEIFPTELIKTEIYQKVKQCLTSFNMQIKLHRHFDIVLKKYHRLKIEKYLFTFLHNVFPFKKKSNFIYFDDKNLFGENVT